MSYIPTTAWCDVAWPVLDQRFIARFGMMSRVLLFICGVFSVTASPPSGINVSPQRGSPRLFHGPAPRLFRDRRLQLQLPAAPNPRANDAQNPPTGNALDGDDCFLCIGNNNDIREHASIHRSSKSSDQTVIGDNNLVMGSCHIAHDCKVGNHNIFANGTLLGGHVVVEDYAHTGGAVAVHQFCHIGSFSFLAGGSVVVQDVPMYTMVAGNRAELRGLNLEGLRRCGFSDMEVKSIRQAYQKLFMCFDVNAGSLDDRLAEVEQNKELAHVPAVLLMVQSVRDCFKENRRGICKFRHWTSV